MNYIRHYLSWSDVTIVAGGMCMGPYGFASLEKHIEGICDSNFLTTNDNTLALPGVHSVFSTSVVRIDFGEKTLFAVQPWFLP